MEVLHFLPKGIATRLVTHYEIIRNDQAEHLIDLHVPNGYASFVFNFTQGVKLKAKATLPPCILVPPFLKAIRIETFGPIDTFVVMCKASVLSRLLGIKLYPRDFMNFIPLSDSYYLSIWQNLKELKIPGDKIMAFEKFLINETTVQQYQTDEIDCIYEHIIEDRGNTPIHEIMCRCRISPRTFRRKFLQRVGVNAKSLSRLVRVNYLWEKISKYQAVDFQEMVFDGRYFDQSHFIKDFKLIIGEKPNHFFKRNLELVKIISGKS